MCARFFRCTAASSRRACLDLFLLDRAAPAVEGDGLGACDRELAGRHVFAHRGARAHRSARTDGDGRDQHRVGAGVCIVFNHGAVFVGAVVVGHDGARADIDPRAHRGVTHIAQVVGLGARAQRAVFHFDEVADVYAIGQGSCGPQPGEGADDRARADARAVEMAEGMHHRARAHTHIAQHGVGPHAGAVGQMHFAFEHAAHVDEHIAATVQRAAHVDAARVGQGDARVEQAARSAQLHHALQMRELAAVVHAEHIVRVGHGGGAHRHTVGHGQGHHVGEVVLALRVVVAQLAQPAAQGGQRRAQNAGVAFAHRALRRRGVFVFDDALHRAVGTTQNAAIACRVVQLDGEQGERARLRLRHQRR